MDRNRREIRKKRKRSKRFKLLAGILLFIVIIGSSMQVSFASQDINGLLTSWFNDKTSDSMEAIDEAIAIEQEKQTDRLKETLRQEIEAAEERLNSAVDDEKTKRITELEAYTDELIDETEIDKEEIKEKKVAELNQILEDAKTEMKKVEASATSETEQESEE